MAKTDLLPLWVLLGCSAMLICVTLLNLGSDPDQVFSDGKDLASDLDFPPPHDGAGNRAPPLAGVMGGSEQQHRRQQEAGKRRNVLMIIYGVFA